MKTPLFHVGQQIVCTNDDFTLLLVQNPNIEAPKRGPIYTVRQNCIFPHAVGLLLEEIRNEHVAPGFPEANFNQDRFAPVPPVEEISLAAVFEESLSTPA
ncbi:hypothetical protein [Hymenobacter metallicola]|uniref:Uncharacterized protein n=1 Tax=Hymenobacter metallicola TaxID=2563114 RepID=A0A4Z0QI71_9BACT|nr:hypothetical protein [Hymenobacter metallicola]TGE29778.1 hypothetical protein E5K02_10050 [Hymenobacter metallicola]